MACQCRTDLRIQLWRVVSSNQGRRKEFYWTQSTEINAFSGCYQKRAGGSNHSSFCRSVKFDPISTMGGGGVLSYANHCTKCPPPQFSDLWIWRFLNDLLFFKKSMTKIPFLLVFYITMAAMQYIHT